MWFKKFKQFYIPPTGLISDPRTPEEKKEIYVKKFGQ